MEDTPKIGQVFICSLSIEDYKLVTKTLSSIDKNIGKALIEICEIYNEIKEKNEKQK